MNPNGRLSGEGIRVGLPQTVEIAIQPLNDPETRNPGFTKTWAELTITVTNKVLTSYAYGGQTYSTRWYIDVLVEWLAEQWNYITHEERTPSPLRVVFPWEARDWHRPGSDLDDVDVARWSAWWQRHGLLSAADGGLIPDLAFRRQGDWLEVSWGARLPAGIPEEVRFTADPGGALIPIIQAASVLWDTLTRAVGLLQARSPEVAARVSARLEALRTPGQARERERLLAGLVQPQLEDLGALVGSEVDDQVRKALLSADAAQGDAPIACDFPLAGLARTAAPQACEADVRAISRTLVPGSPGKELGTLIDVVSAGVRHEVQGWRPGWYEGREAARLVVDRLGLDRQEGPVDAMALATRLEVRVEDASLGTNAAGAAILVRDQVRPTIVINRAKMSRDTTKALTLMPEQRLRRAWNTYQGTLEDRVSRLSGDFRVSRFAVLNHLVDLDLVDQADRDELVEAWSVGP